ncbi:MAG: translocation/assembly module TamB, partial [Sulfurovum sp.]|nr:translocation/assembly module TamB [Sulfurovum sp.]
NSSYVIAKIADEYAPDYNISYDKISGNIFTGIEVKNLKYANQTISNNIVYKWNPLTLVQKKITVDQMKIENVNINVIKALITSFDVDESDDNSSGSFDFDIGVENIDISIDPFQEEGIAVNKTIITADDILYHSDGRLEVDNLFVDIDSNLSKFSLKGSMDEGELHLSSLQVNTLDSEMLETILLAQTQDKTTKNQTKNKAKQVESEKSFIPAKVKIDHFSGFILPREYMSTEIKKLYLELDNLDIDVKKIFENKYDIIQLESLVLKLDTNITSVELNASLKDEHLAFKTLSLKHIDIYALQKLFPDDNDSVEQSKENHKVETNIWIPKQISIEQLYADIVPMDYDPIEVSTLGLQGKKIELDVNRLMLKKGYIELNGTSNVSDITFLGNVRENQLDGKTSLLPHKALYEVYNLPMRADAIEPIVIDLNASEKHVVAALNTRATQVLEAKKDAFNIDIDSLISNVVYNIDTSTLRAESKVKVTTPYAKDISISNTFMLDDTMQYYGTVKAPTMSGLDVKMAEALKNLDIRYKGDDKSIHADLSSKQMKGSFNSDDMKKGRFVLKTIEALKLNKFVTLPAELNATKVNVDVDFPINFEKMDLLKGKVAVTSNLLNIDADIIFDEALKIEAETNIPNKSLLRDYNKEIKWNALTPMDIDMSMKEERVRLNLKSNALKAKIKYHLGKQKVKGEIAVEGLVTTIAGNVDKEIKISSNVSSMKSLKKGITSLYTLEDFPPLEGTASLSTTITALKRVDFVLYSPKIIYKVDRKTKHVLHDVTATAFIEDSKVELSSYTLAYNQQIFFSTKPSRVDVDETFITLESIWLNDSLDVTGQYNKKTKKGTIYAKANSYPIVHEYADINAMIDLESKLDGNKTSVDGNITLLDGKIKYNIAKKTFASDDDIIFVQEMKKKNDSLFMKNLSTNIQLNTKEPLVLKQGAINIKLKPELGIHKVENEELMVLGSVEILKGGTYMFEGKKFVLSKSAIHFTGNPNKPLLELKVKYRALNHRITILISGTADAPIIHFSSNPSLSKEQILSLILFDTEAGGDAHSGDEMMKMMGGAMAKSALSNLGVQLDHLVLGEGNSIEVGKKLTDKITIIYVDGEVSRVKLKYRHSPRTDSVIQMSEESQSYDIIFKDDF